MMGPFWYRALPLLSLAVFGLTLKPQVGIGAIFDTDEFKHKSQVFNDTFYESVHLQRRDFTMFARSMRAEENVYDMFRNMCRFLDNQDFKALLVVGNQNLLQSVGQVARPMGIPVIGYTTDKTVDKYVQIHNPLLLMMKPSKIDQAQAFLRFFQANFWFNIIVFVQDTLVIDGFYDHMKVNSSQPKWSIRAETISHDMSKLELSNVIKTALGPDPRIVVIHTDLALAVRTFTIVKQTNLTAVNHAWFVTETSYSREHEELEEFPAGTMAIIPNYAVREDDVIVDGTNFMIKSVINLLNKQPVKRHCWGKMMESYESQGKFMFSNKVSLSIR